MVLHSEFGSASLGCLDLPPPIDQVYVVLLNPLIAGLRGSPSSKGPKNPVLLIDIYILWNNLRLLALYGV